MLQSAYNSDGTESDIAQFLARSQDVGCIGRGNDLSKRSTADGCRQISQGICDGADEPRAKASKLLPPCVAQPKDFLMDGIVALLLIRIVLELRVCLKIPGCNIDDKE